MVDETLILFMGHMVCICMDDLSFQEPIFYPKLLLISFHGDLKPVSQLSHTAYVQCCIFKNYPHSE